MRSPIFSTRPLATLRMRASSTVSAPVAGLVFTTLTISPTDFLEQLLRRQQVEFEVLLAHLELAAVAVQEGGFRPQLGADVDEGEVLDARREGDAAAILHQRQVLVVDGDRHGGLVGLGDPGLRGLGPRRRDDEAEAGGGADEAGGCQQQAPAAGALIHWIPLSGWTAAGGRVMRPYTRRAFRRKWGGTGKFEQWTPCPAGNGEKKKDEEDSPQRAQRTQRKGECALRAPGKSNPLCGLCDLCGGSFQRLDRIGATFLRPPKRASRRRVDPMSSGE